LPLPGGGFVFFSPKRAATDWLLLCEEYHLEVRALLFQRDERGCLLEPRVRPEQCLNLLEVVLVIGGNVQQSAGQKRTIQGVHELRCEKPAPVMPLLGPGVRKEHVERSDAQGRQHELDAVRGFDPQQAHVPDAPPDGFAVYFAQAPQQALDSQEVDLGMRRCTGEKETPLAASDVDLQRPGGVEQGFQRQLAGPARGRDDRGWWFHAGTT